MPKTGSAVCRQCGFTQTGFFPDDHNVGYNYQFIVTRPSLSDKIDPHLAEELISHHVDTREYKEDTDRIKSTGHSRYRVELEDGSKGDLTANPYGIVYIEKGREIQY